MEVFDTPNDNGHALTVTWKLSPDDGAGKNNVVAYEILRCDSPDGEFEVRGMAPARETIDLISLGLRVQTQIYFPANQTINTRNQYFFHCHINSFAVVIAMQNYRVR